MTDQKKLSSYFLTRRSVFKSPLKRSGSVSKKTTSRKNATQFLSLKELLSSPVVKSAEPRPLLLPLEKSPVRRTGHSTPPGAVSPPSGTSVAVVTPGCVANPESAAAEGREAVVARRGRSASYGSAWRRLHLAKAAMSLETPSGEESVAATSSPAKLLEDIYASISKTPVKRESDDSLRQEAMCDNRKRLFLLPSSVDSKSPICVFRLPGQREKKKVSEDESSEEQEGAQQPAFKRFAHFCRPLRASEAASAVPPKPRPPVPQQQLGSAVSLSELHLPAKYHRLHTMFSAVEDVLCVLKKRDEACPFEKLKASVQRFCGMVFMKRHLRMMLHLWPEAYNVYLTGSHTFLSASMGSDNPDKLIVEANYRSVPFSSTSSTATSTATPTPPLPFPSFVTSPHHATEGSPQPLLQLPTPGLLVARKRHFLQLLHSLTLAHHSRFLSGLGITVSAKSLKRWHPKFNIEEVPDVPEGDHLPESSLPPPHTAKTMLRMVCHTDDPMIVSALLGASHHLDAPPTTLSSSEESNCHDAAVTASTTTTPPSPSQEPSLMKFVPQHLLQRVRLKEREARQRHMTRDPNVDALLIKLHRLPDLIRCINNLFAAQKRTYLPMQECADKVQFSCMPDFSLDAVEQHIDLVLTTVPRWLHSISLHGTPYLGFTKNPITVNQAVDEANHQITQLQPR